MDCNYKIHSRQNRRKSSDKDSNNTERYISIAIDAAIGRVESPSCVNAAIDHSKEGYCSSDDIKIPGEQIEFREGKVTRPNHNGYQKVPQDRRNGRNQEEEDHQDAVHTKHLVVGF